jgi:virginiamycin B lyase
VDQKGQYVWYTDNFKPYLGRLDTHTGEIKEYSFSFLPGMGVDTMLDPRRKEEAFTETGGANKIAVAPNGNLIIASNIGRAIIVFDPKTEKFKLWPSGSVFFGIDPAGKVWYATPAALQRLDPETGEIKNYPPPPSPTGYDVDEDSQGRFIYNVWRGAKIGIFDPKTEKYAEYPTPSPGSGPRRGTVDAQDRWWTGLYWAGTIARFDPSKGEVKEFSLIPGVKAYETPYLASYIVAVDDKNQLAWTSDFNSGRMYAFNLKTEKPTEFFMPAPYEVRHLAIDKAAPRPTVWIPAYRPPSKIVKVQMR